jgi:Uma2 family endonuclease
MSVVSSEDKSIDYPESDGKPMGETDWHIDWTLRLRDMLKLRYRGQRVYVASDLLLYYHEGVPQDFVVPDGFVVLDCDPGRRRIFKTWEEQRVPNVVFEFTSQSTRRTDEVFKPRIYAEIGVAEYFVYDPHGEYLTPRLQGHRLGVEGTFARIVPDEQGRLDCRQLGLTLELDGGELVLRDAASGALLLTAADASAIEARVAKQDAKAAKQEAEAAKQEAKELARRNADIEAELQRLRQALEQREE